MTRLFLCCGLCGLTLVLALATAAVQSKNRERGIALDALKEECDMLEAINAERSERILALDWRPLALEDVERPEGAGAKTGARGASEAP